MALTPEQSQAVDRWLAANAGDDAPLVKALLTAGELSNGDPTARSPKGARGLMQLTPIALKDIGIDPDTFDYDSPSASLRAGLTYVRKLRDGYGLTNPLQIAAAYNAGPGTVKEAVAAGTLGALPAETQSYVKRMAAALGAVPAQRTEGAAVASGGGQAVAPAPATQPTVQPTAAPSAPTPRASASLPKTIAKDAPLAEALQPYLDQEAASANNPTASTLGTIFQAPTRLAAGLADVAAQGGAMMFGGPNATPQDFSVGSMTERVNQQYGQPAPGVGELVDAGAQGAVMGALAGPVGAVTGAVGGVASEVLADVAERMGLPRVVGGLAGGLGVGLAAGTVRAGGALLREGRATKEATKAALQELDDAKQALEAQPRLNRLRVRSERTAATAAADRALQTRQAVEAEVQRNVDQFLLQNKTPVERAAMLQQVAQGRRNAVHSYISGRYADFLKRADDSGGMVRVANIRQTAGSLIDDIESIGLPRDQAATHANAIMKNLDREAMTFSEAQALRSGVGKFYAQADGPAKYRLGELNDAIETQMQKALPDAMKPEFTKLRAYRRAEARLFQESYARKALSNDDAGREAATQFISRQLGSKWTPAKQAELRELMVAAGDGGRDVLRDAVMRQALRQASRGVGQGVEVNWGDLGRVLRNPEGLRPIVMELFSPAEQRALMELSDEAAKAALRAEAAQGAIVTREAAVRDLGRDATDAARLRVQQARRAAPAPVRSSDSVLTQISSLALTKSGLVRLFLDPTRRKMLRRALSVSANSQEGKELMRLLVGGVTVSQEPATP